MFDESFLGGVAFNNFPLSRGSRFKPYSSHFNLGVQRDLRIEQARNRAANLGGVGEGENFRLVGTGNLRRHVEMRCRHGKAGLGLVERDGRGGLDGFGGEAGLAKFRRERHRETARVRCADEFLRIRAETILEPRAEGVLRFLEHAALGGEAAFAVL